MSEYITASNGDLSTLSNISHPLQTLPRDSEHGDGFCLGRGHLNVDENRNQGAGLESDTLDMFSEPTSLVNELDHILDARSDGTITPQAEQDTQGYADDDYNDQMELELRGHAAEDGGSKFLSGEFHLDCVTSAVDVICVDKRAGPPFEDGLI